MRRTPLSMTCRIAVAAFRLLNAHAVQIIWRLDNTQTMK